MAYTLPAILVSLSILSLLLCAFIGWVKKEGTATLPLSIGALGGIFGMAAALFGIISSEPILLTKIPFFFGQPRSDGLSTIFYFC